MIKKIGESLKEWDILQDEYIREFIDYLKESIKQLLEKLNNE